MVVSIATAPPSETPMRVAGPSSSSSRSWTTSPDNENVPTAGGDWPKPRRSRRTIRKRSEYDFHCGSHIRLSAIPSWINTTGEPEPACST